MNPSSSNARLRPFRPVPFGRYTLLSQLATGGMGEIFLARLEGAAGFEKLCIIKKMLPQLAADPEFVERFVGEARTLVRLSHGSIAQVLDMGLHEGEAYMALEYVDGKDLRKVAARSRDRQRPLPLTFILFVMGRVLDALAYAHRKKGDDGAELNLVHRDISPPNILISYEGEVKVIDFGLAKSRLSAARTNPSIIVGKFLYMSPEQARHQPVDRRGDLYAVGLCLYELLSGRNPFDVLPPGELMSAVAWPNIPPLGEVLPSVPPPVAQLVMKALAVDPAQRFQSAEEFRGRLMGCLLEVDADSGPESVSRYMHELFAPEYQAERRLLASLREVAEGLVEPLSFRPTPRAREGSPVRSEGETHPAVVVETVAIEDTPVWAEPLRADEPQDEPDSAAGPEVDVRLADTDPRIELPLSSHEDTQPRVSLAEVYLQDTQPRVVLDASLLREPEQEEVSQRGRSKPGVARVARPRGTPTSSPPAPRRSWLWVAVGLGVLLLGSGVGAFFLEHTPEPVRPPPPSPLFPPESQGRQAPAADSARAAAVEVAPAPVKPAPVEPAPVEPAPSEPTPEQALLAPLTPAPAVTEPPPPKRTSLRKRTSSRGLSTLQREWARTRTAWKSLTRVHGCESLDFLCGRYQDLEAEVVGMGGVEDAALLGKVRALYRDIQKRRRGS